MRLSGSTDLRTYCSGGKLLFFKIKKAFATICSDVDGRVHTVIQSEISQKEKDQYHIMLFICEILKMV